MANGVQVEVEVYYAGTAAQETWNMTWEVPSGWDNTLAIRISLVTQTMSLPSLNFANVIDLTNDDEWAAPVDTRASAAAEPETPRPGSESGAIHWRFTLFANEADTQLDDSVGEELADALDLSGIYKAGVFQLERCPTSGRLHFQGHLICKRKQRFNQIKQSFRNFSPEAGRTVNIDKSHSPKSQIEYCQKEDTRVSGPWKFGDTSLVAVGKAHKGRRKDIEEVVEMARRGATEDEIFDAHPTVYFHHRNKILQVIAMTQRRTRVTQVKNGLGEPTVTVYWGKSGVGKTRRVHSRHGTENVYVPLVQGRSLWFEGYSGQKVLLLDDFDPETIPLSLLLKLCDRYTMQMPVKGASMTPCFEYIYFTSNSDPKGWYNHMWMDKPELQNAFLRRMTGGIHYMTYSMKVFTQLKR